MRRKKSISKVRFGRQVGACGVGMIGILGIMMLFPVVRQDSFAACVDGTETEECVGSYARAELSMTTNTVISLTMDKAVNVEVTPRSNGAVGESSAKVGVATNSSEGYAVYLRTGNADGALKPITSNISGEIKNTGLTNVTLDDLETNAYGYALTRTPVDNTTTYSRIPTEGGIIKSTTDVTVGSGEYAYGDEYYLSFGTKIGTSLPSGTYSGSVILSVVANPTTLRSLYDLTYMQEMTPELCEATGEHYTKQLIDTRDGKSYWVAKLKDGNCWMTQNLALDITEDGLKASDTDITHDWNAQYTGNGLSIGTDVIPSGAQAKDEYVPTATQDKITNFGTSNKSTYSWNFGQWVLGAPTLVVTCGDQTTIAACTKVGFVDVSESDWKPTFTARVLRTGETVTLDDGNLLITSTTDNPQVIAVDPIAKTYDPHYLIGNYYQFNAATAGASGDVEDGNIEVSICPKGWRLPTGGSAYQDPNNNFYSLLENYGLDRSLTGTDGKESYNIAGQPLYFTRSGLINISNSKLRYSGLSGSLWSRTASSHFSDDSATPSAYYLNFNNVEVSNYKLELRWVGYPVRCIAR